MYRIVGLSQQFGVINPQIDPLWVIFADFDNLSLPGELFLNFGPQKNSALVALP